MKIKDHVTAHHSFMYLWIVGALLVFGGLVYSYIGSHPTGIIDGQHEGDVRTTVAQFGNQLNTVSVGAPTAPDAIRDAYASYVTPELLAEWMQDPLAAPGRVTSSPWPDHIEVDSVVMNAEGAYDVAGRIMLMASTGDAGIIPVFLTVTDVGGSFLISRYEENPQEEAALEGVATDMEPSSVTASLGETVLLGSISITPLEVLEDSRCPADVQCIQAGTVRIRATISSKLGSGMKEFVLDGSVPTEAETIGFTAVMPQKVSTAMIVNDDYRFTFAIEPR